MWTDIAGGPAVGSTAAEAVARRIRDLIHRGELQPGDRLPSERELCDRFGIARLTLRQGLQLLRAEGYLQVVSRGPQGGTFVTDLSIPLDHWKARLLADPAELDDIIDIRAALEAHGAALAARRRTQTGLRELRRLSKVGAQTDDMRAYRQADLGFHAAVLDCAGSRRLAQLVPGVRAELFTPANQFLAVRSVVEDSMREHAEIAEAIGSRDENAAAQLMETHIRRTRVALRELLGLAAE